MAEPDISLKLLVDKKGQRVLHAEAPKEFVDFLFHLFSLPLGTVVQILAGSKEMAGSLSKLKESVDILDTIYLQPGIKKDDIFNPKTPFKGNPFLETNHDSFSVDESAESKDVYRCSNTMNHPHRYHNINVCSSNVTFHVNSICTGCDGYMRRKMTVITPKEVAVAEVEDGQVVEKEKKACGFVKEVVTYMVMDDLVVKPMSTVSCVAVFNDVGVKDLSQLEEMMVSFGKDEALKLFKASLSTDKVLTTVYIDTNIACGADGLRTSKRRKQSK